MRIYRLGAGTDEFSSLAAIRESDLNVLREFDGTSLQGRWKPIPVEPILELSRSGIPGDYTRLGTVPAFSERAVQVLDELLLPNGELLPLDIKSGKYFVYNVTTVADVLDEDRSSLERLRSGKIMMINRHAFQAGKLETLVVFKLPQLPRTNVYVTELFLQKVRQTSLTGFDFEEVWPDNPLARRRDCFGHCMPSE